MAVQNEHWTDFVCDDAITLYTQYSTQWDALSHIAEAREDIWITTAGAIAEHCLALPPGLMAG